MASDFESLMTGMGVKRMDDAKERKPKTTKRRPAKTKQTASKAAPASVAGVDSERTAELERVLGHIKDERAAAESKVATLQKRVKRLKKQIATAETELAKPRLTVSQILAEWGFETAAERAQVLGREDWLERIISEPDLAEATALKDEVMAGWVRVCEQCSAPRGKTALIVPAERCSSCGGFDLEREARRFVDAALINGRLRIVIVGRESADHRQVREWVADKRLILTQLPGSVKRDRASVRTDADHADAVVIWDADSLSDADLEIYRKASRVGEVTAASLGGFLSAAAEIIGGD